MKFNRYITLLALLLVAGSIFSPSALAIEGDVLKVTRNVPDDTVSGESITITLELVGESPFMVGIVETIPEGFLFPETDSEVSDETNFKIDRDANKIAFSVVDENEVAYKVIPSVNEDNENNEFKGYWVDMLYQTQDLNEGKERWQLIIDPNADPATSSELTDDTLVSDDVEYVSTSDAPGFGILLALIAMIGCLFIFRISKKGDKK